MRAIALIDGEHYPPVVRAALATLAAEYDLAAAVFVGGTEKVDTGSVAADVYGVPVLSADDPADALRAAIVKYAPDVAIDLSDEPVVTAADRFRLASVALGHDVTYRGADFTFTPPRAVVDTNTPTLAVIGTGKRVGKTAVSAAIARLLDTTGTNVVVLAMGRGGPAEPELIRGDEVALTTADLLALARTGVHAASDSYEDAVMSRVKTVGCRRCGGGLAGETFVSNVPDGAQLADGLGCDLIMLEGSGSAIPPVVADAAVVVVGAGRGVTYVRDHFGPYRIGRAELVIVTGAEEPLSSSADRSEMLSAIRTQRQDVPVVFTTFRPRPLADVTGSRVFFATTAPEPLLPVLARHLEAEYGCTVVGASAHLSDRAKLRADMAAATGSYDVLLTELKAAAIDVVAAVGEEAGVPTVLCDNVPVAVDGSDLDEAVMRVARIAMTRGQARSG